MLGVFRPHPQSRPPAPNSQPRHSFTKGALSPAAATAFSHGPRKAPSPTRLSHHTLNRTACFQSKPPRVSPFPFTTGAITAPSLTQRSPPSVPGPQSKPPGRALPFSQKAPPPVHSATLFKRLPDRTSAASIAFNYTSPVHYHPVITLRHASDHPITCSRPINARSRRAALVPLPRRGSLLQIFFIFYHQRRHIAL